MPNMSFLCKWVCALNGRPQASWIIHSEGCPSALNAPGENRALSGPPPEKQGALVWNAPKRRRVSLCSENGTAPSSNSTAQAKERRKGIRTRISMTLTDSPSSVGCLLAHAGRQLIWRNALTTKLGAPGRVVQESKTRSKKEGTLETSVGMGLKACRCLKSMRFPGFWEPFAPSKPCDLGPGFRTVALLLMELV